MTDDRVDLDQLPPPPASAKRRMPVGAKVFLGVLALVVVGIVVAVGLGLRQYLRPVPDFPSLVATPDSSLRGTVAYYDTDRGCVRVIAASGAASKDAYCFEAADDENGPQLAWRDDGRLEVTVFTWPTGGEVTGKWQRLIDVSSGEVEEVPKADVPNRPEPSAEPAVGPNGEQVTYTDKGGKIVVELATDEGSRTLLSAQGPSPGYEVKPGGQPVWSPDGEWVMLDDDRLLLITVDTPSKTRVLVDPVGGLGSYRSFEVRLFAVTDQTLVGPGS